MFTFSNIGTVFQIALMRKLKKHIINICSEIHSFFVNEIVKILLSFDTVMIENNLTRGFSLSKHAFV